MEMEATSRGLCGEAVFVNPKLAGWRVFDSGRENDLMRAFVVDEFGQELCRMGITRWKDGSWYFAKSDPPASLLVGLDRKMVRRDGRPFIWLPITKVA